MNEDMARVWEIMTYPMSLDKNKLWRVKSEKVKENFSHSLHKCNTRKT